MKRQLITEAQVRAAHREQRALKVDEGALFTPSAQDAIRDLRVKMISAEGVSGGAVKERPGSMPAFRVVGVASDHGGVLVKGWVCRTLGELGIEYRDHGVDSADDTCDYPDKAAEIAEKVQRGIYWRGIVVDGAGIGSAMAANKFVGIRAGLVYDSMTATNARAHNNINVMTLGGQYLGEQLVNEIVRIFINTDFEGGRHQRRLEKIRELENRERG